MMRSTSPIISFPKNPPGEKSANDQDRDSRPQHIARKGPAESVTENRHSSLVVDWEIFTLATRWPKTL
jgi:hypothetical protein